MAIEGKAKGGVARAKSLSAQDRQAIAKRAAQARWAEDLPLVVCGSPDRPLRIADIEIQCYVLEDGIRVLSTAGFLLALGRHRRATMRSDQHLPTILQGKALSEFLTADIIEQTRPIAFRLSNGVRATGYRAESLPTVCELYLRARDAGKLAKNQLHIAKQAEILVRGLAAVGIIALVDEATGYQELRARNALSKILEEFIAKELQAYVQTFPDDYYREMFRLRGLRYPDDSVKRPQYFGTLTNGIVYERLAPGVLDELRRVTPKSESGRRRHKFFQRLTTNIGYPKLREHLGSVVTLMKLSSGWHDFSDKLNQIHPRYNNTLPLPLRYDESKDDGKGL